MSSQYLYRHFDKEGNLLYVGISLSAINRLNQHKEHAHWFSKIGTVSIERFESREDAINAERVAIRKENPKHNIYRPSVAEQKKDEIIEENNRKKSKIDLIKRIVQFNPLYSRQEAAMVLTVSTQQINRWISEKKLGCIYCGEVKTRHGTSQKIKITGWQLIDFIENWEKGLVNSEQ